MRYIIRNYDIKEMHVPFYLCPVIRRAVIKENCKPVFYHVNDDFMPVQEFDRDDFILYPNYFGICDKNASLLAEKYPHLVVDNAHSFYSEPMGFASFNSARKFFPVYNGSFLWIRDLKGEYQKENEFHSAPKNEEEMYKNETSFDDDGIELLNDITAEKIVKFDDLEIRKEKFLQLHNKYGDKNLLNIDTSAKSPFCYPCLLKTSDMADELVKKLKTDGYKIYRYWEELPKDFPEYRFYACLVAISLSKDMKKSHL